MAQSRDEGRIFTKVVDGVTKRRRVYSAADEVAATFDGFTETKAATKAPAGGAGAGSTNTGPAAK